MLTFGQTMGSKFVYEKQISSYPVSWCFTPVLGGQTFEEWARVSHLKDTTLDVLRSNEIDDLSTVRLLNAEDIKRLPIKLGQAKLLEYAVKKLKRADNSLNNSKDTSISQSRGSSPERKADSFYIVPSPTKSGRKSPARFSQVEVDDSPEDESPCTIRITIETKKEDEMDPEETGYIEEIINPSKNLITDLNEETIAEEEAAPEGRDDEEEEEKEEAVEEVAEEEPVTEEEPHREEEEDEVHPTEEREEEDHPVQQEEEEKELPEGELDETRHDCDLEVKGEQILPPPPPPPPIEVPAEVNRVTLQLEANATDLATPVLMSPDRRGFIIPCLDAISNREDVIKNAARRIVAESIADRQGDDEFTRDSLAAFFDGAYGSTLIRLSNDHGTLKFLVPQLAETAIQTEPVEEEQVKEEEADQVKEEEAGDCTDSISGDLSTPLCDLPPPEDDEERDRMPDPPQIEEVVIQKPDGRKESVAFDPNNNPNAIPNFHIPKEVNKFGNYMQVQMLGEDLHNPPSTRRPMSPVVSQPIRWECNRSNKGSSPPRAQKTPPTKTSSPVRHRTPSPQRFKSPDRGSRVRVANGAPAGTAYRPSGEIDPRAKESPPKEIVNKIRNNIESPEKVRSPPKPRSPSPVKPFDTEAFRLARKLAQEVADCPADCIMVRVKDLQKCPKSLLPPELDKAYLEEYISDTEFRRTLGMGRSEFAEFSEWKQQEIKKELGLF